MNDEPTAGPETIFGHPVALFGSAVLHIIVAGKRNSWRFLFGYVELLPREIPPPQPDGVITGPHLRQSGYRVFADHVPITVERGLQWYRDALDGRVVRPDAAGSIQLANDPDAVLCESNDWNQEPTWPDFVSAASADVLPFLARWHRTPRAHHLITSSQELPFQPNEIADLDDFFERDAGFRRSAFPQLFGSAHLIVPNPYYRKLHEALGSDVHSNAPSSAHESINVYVDTRSGVKLPPMNINIVDHRPSGVGRSVTVALTSALTNVPMGTTLRQTSAVVTLESDGSVLETRKASPFMRDFQLTMDIASSKRRVDVTHSNGNVVETYEVSVVHPHTSNGGSRSPRAAADLLDSMLREIEVRASAKSLDQRWFAYVPESARNFIRQQIQRAREQILFADPYFSGIEVQRFALATSVAGVAVRVLTTRDGFPAAGISAEALIANITRWKKDPSLGRLEVRILDRSELHDRFLRVDDRVYSLGNSLNAIGDKASLFIRVPDPAPVILEFEKLWKKATRLEDFAGIPSEGEQS